MAQALRVVSVQRGYDPAAFKLGPFGGAGPLHALAVATETGIRSVLVPPRPGVASALGLLVAELKHDFASTVVERLESADPGALEQAFKSLEELGREPLRRESVSGTSMRFERALDVRYVGQSYHLTIPLAQGLVSRAVLDGARDRFNGAHFAAYGYAEPSEPCEVVNVRVSALGTIPRAKLRGGGIGDRGKTQKRARPVWFEATGFVDCPIYDRAALAGGSRLEGPAVLEDRDATTLVHRGWRCYVDASGALRLDHA